MTKRLTLNIPDVLMDAVREYQKVAGLKSVAQAATILLARSVSADADKAEQLIAQIRQSWGGQREGAFGRKAKD